MGGLRKTASRIHRAIGKTDPIAWKAVGEKATDATEDFTAKYVWGGPIDPENPNPELPPVQPMPEQDDASTDKARKRNQSRRRAASGRSSTILSDGQGLGG